MTTRFVGWDLTDPFARAPRPVDEAVLDAEGHVRFSQRMWPRADARHGLDPEALREAFAVGPGDVVVVDGPQALANPGSRVRDAERRLRAPGRTPDVLPQPGPPFAGFVRGSVLLFAALRGGAGVPLLDLDTPEPSRARLFEAFPGATWRTLAVEKLGGKATPEGRARRQALLEAEGLRFVDGGPCTHDQLDATACAWLGWLTRARPGDVTAVGLPLTQDPDGTLREGRILDRVQSLSRR
ncbi:DUF429 domain-containing protein [Corallococcus praedator]|uniref:DUF429 domain-containing protein n=1 Tax=Corallococcus praedator TaxID=2316724 RepID=A0ABX9Q4H6_9BACT|nr:MULTISPECIES: DUF429 domain-containing protein [Corallococcus]RKH18944.1 DUF429 domain-containing protein [Corallococcus sp. CA031C]RKH90652.1 DUF429 domain-containing protein [Corallococcus praedator]